MQKKNQTEQTEKNKEKAKNNNLEIITSIILSFVFGILLFVLVPLWLTNLVKVKWSIGAFSFNIIDGIIRLIIFLLYVFFDLIYKRYKTSFRVSWSRT